LTRIDVKIKWIPPFLIGLIVQRLRLQDILQQAFDIAKIDVACDS
jgi:hypothetical protein